MSALPRVALAAVAAFAVARWLEPVSTQALRPDPTAEPRRIEITKIEVAKANVAPAEIAKAEVAKTEPAPAARKPRPPAPPAPAPPQPPPLPAASRAPQVKQSPALTGQVLARGSTLLRAGAFPRMRATYRRIGFDAYRDAMLALGGAFYLFDAAERRPVAEVDPKSGALGPAEVRAGLSRWPRDVTRHLGDALARGAERYGPRVTRVILLPPESVDAALLGALDAHLREQGLTSDQLLRVDVAYEMHHGRLHCQVLSLALRDGSERELELRIDLSGGGLS